MKNKYIYFLCCTLCCTVFFAQTKQLTLKECILAALNNKPNILSLKTDESIALLKTKELKANYWPQISLAYDYLYNPILKTNIIPVGLFSNTPSDKMETIKFGTNWQQTAGVNVLQPLFDANIKSKLNESKIQEKLKNTELNISNEALVVEVAQSFINVLLKEQQSKEVVYDTLRTHQTLMVAKDRFEKGKSLKTEVNKAQINHNNTLNNYKELVTATVNEKTYLAFLTNTPYNTVLINKDDNLLIPENLNWINIPSNTKNFASVQKLNTQILLAKQQINSERNKYLPLVSVKGYLGADQFANKLNEVVKNAWYGNSFIGLSAKWSLLFGENRSNKIDQLQLQIKSYNLLINEATNEAEKNRIIAINEINKIQAECKMHEENIKLYKESLLIYQERLKEGQESASNINNEEFDYQKENQKLQTNKSQMWLQWLNYLKNAGLLSKLYL